MVNKLAEISPRSADTFTLTSDVTGDDFFRPKQERTTYILENGLDKYAETSIEKTHSQDPDFSNSVTLEQGLPTRPDIERPVAVTDSAELLEFTVETQEAPTSGSFIVWEVTDHAPVPLNSSELNAFKELNEGRTYAVDFQASIADAATLTAGIRNPDSAANSIFVRQFGISVGGDATVTTEIDHGSYSDGTGLTVINKKPELQVERPISASVTRDPTISNPQESMTAFLPGGSAGGTSTGNRFAQADYELTPGQDLTVQITNESSSSDRFGFSLELIETVVR